MAGSDTTARVLIATLVNIIQQEALLSRLRKELDPLFSRSSNVLPESRQLESVPLLRATVQEGLRFASTITNRGTLIARKEDLSCQGVLIPRGVSHLLEPTDCPKCAYVLQLVPNLNDTKRRPL